MKRTIVLISVLACLIVSLFIAEDITYRLARRR
jgi:hypothetical protein